MGRGGFEPPLQDVPVDDLRARELPIPLPLLDRAGVHHQRTAAPSASRAEGGTRSIPRRHCSSSRSIAEAAAVSGGAVPLVSVSTLHVLRSD